MRSQLVDHETGRPIAVDLKTWTIHYLDTPEARAAFLATGAQSWRKKGADEASFPWQTYMKRADWPQLEPLLAERSDGKGPQPARLTEEQIEESLADLSRQVDRIAEAQDDRGVWVQPVPGQRDRATSVGSFIELVDGRMYPLLQLIEYARILSGGIKREIWTYPSPLVSGLRHENMMAGGRSR